MLVEDLRQIYKRKPIGVVVLKKDKINPKIIEIFDQSFDKIIISTISSKDILSKKEIQENPLLEKFEFMENLNDALDAIDKMNYAGGKVVFGSHYIAKDVYNFFDFFFDNGTI
jgi:dihydrofolate synthase/folylpolyglutamate synthase